MARFARVVALGVPHHITQRGNARRFILDSDAERRVYLDLLRRSAERSEIELICYCLMSNHVHLIAIPNKANVLGLALKDAHGRYASYWNAMHCSSGHVWQGRYYSCPLDESHLWEALRYTEAGESQAALAAIRHNTHTGRPLGSAEFLRAVEGQTKRRLALQKRGPKRAAEPGKSQGTFSFGA
jgi:REP-associated tyrosine transposase